VNDLTPEEQWYLYEKARELKKAVADGGDVSAFQLRNSESSVWLIFMEDSTRTKESFRNAAEFHGLKVNVFDCNSSSFKKSETITDTIKMLCGYSTGQSTFVVRSKLEGVCKWLEEAMSGHAKNLGVPRPSFLNAGDGRHEHPSQEFLDQFSFLEQKGWDNSSIHLTLLGDLFHGRTVHSKVDGLKIYGKVEVDLIAPAELALPKMYEDRMREAGFTVRKFGSIAEYLEQDHISEIWYFTRLQLERMGDQVLSKADALRDAVTFKHEFVDRLPTGTKFFHPLPRDSRHPEIPFWLDNTKFNGWDQQSQNGYFTRIILLGMVGGHLGKDFRVSASRAIQNASGSDSTSEITPEKTAFGNGKATFPESPASSNSPFLHSSDFIEVLRRPESPEKKIDVGIYPIADGIVIDHIAKGQTAERIWDRMDKVRINLGLSTTGAQGAYYSSSDPQKMKGIMSLPNFDVSRWDRANLKRLAALTPGSTVNIVQGNRVQEKYRLHIPPRIYNFSDISCSNTACISHTSNLQREVEPYFLRSATNRQEEGGATFSCKYCEHVHSFDAIWASK